ncbi:EF-hand domain-containing protein [Paraburkholderia caballeronis]|uniref:EF-hand domain-containing protein n=1 Tax=Paraburkholderia caballeronis TaxID=416943 RepID=UPI001064A45D|nr:EF-hand domain-containing protein [Paraburkholderia caballeronis]TDV05024.1 EF hand domain-containing protein [Paraburkholderia caballeronis]TDV19157.1 EF hand domain-containing protein [Paraburkholderia caballeronis]TDV21123.1 EF hand domain-containing protein [Paraburkholderia caballeronis]
MSAITTLPPIYTSYANSLASQGAASASLIADAQAQSAAEQKAAGAAAAKNAASFDQLRAKGVDIETVSFGDLYKSQLASDVDQDGDGNVSLQELTEAVVAGGGSADSAQSLFSAMDADGNGVVTDAEFQNSVPNPFTTDRFTQFMQQELRTAQDGSAGQQTNALSEQAQHPQTLDTNAILAGLATQLYAANTAS